MHTASYEFLMKPEQSVGCHQTLSWWVWSWDETIMYWSREPAIFFQWEEQCD